MTLVPRKLDECYTSVSCEYEALGFNIDPERGASVLGSKYVGFRSWKLNMLSFHWQLTFIGKSTMAMAFGWRSFNADLK